MRVRLHRKHENMGFVEVEPDGALLIQLGKNSVLRLPAKVSRRIAGEVLRVSVEHTADSLRGRVDRAAAALLGEDDQ